MHPTDTLLSLSHARIARAAAAGPRKATQPTALTDRQHLARIAQAGCVTVTVGDNGLPGCGGNSGGHSVGAAIVRLNTLARADGFLAQRIDQL